MKNQIPEGFVPNNSKFISNQPHLTVNALIMTEPPLINSDVVGGPNGYASNLTEVFRSRKKK